MAKKDDGFTKDELSFIKAPPEEIEIECPICFQVMLNDPHQLSCGHHFCGTCIKRVKECSLCRRTVDQVFKDENRLRIINGLKVNCTNKGCEWKGELKDLSTHLNKGKREGQCQYEVVTCVHSGCEIKKQRQYLVKHEKDECPQRPYECRYCHHKGTYQSINKHYQQCTRYPVPCPNKCGLHRAIPRCIIQTHVTEECPLQSVECEFKWAGCQYTSLRKDLRQHNNDSQLEHMSLLAKECGELKKGNEELKKENQELKKANEELKRANEELKQKMTRKMTHIHHTVVGDTYPILPVDVPLDGNQVHFYTEPLGHHMSAKRVRHLLNMSVFFTVYKGKFDQPKVTNVVVKINGVTTVLTAANPLDNYTEYPNVVRGDVVQKFSFTLASFINLEIISAH